MKIENAINVMIYLIPLPAIYYACPKGDELEGALWGSTSVNLLTPTGMTMIVVQNPD